MTKKTPARSELAIWLTVDLAVAVAFWIGSGPAAALLAGAATLLVTAAVHLGQRRVDAARVAAGLGDRRLRAPRRRRGDAARGLTWQRRRHTVGEQRSEINHPANVNATGACPGVKVVTSNKQALSCCSASSVRRSRTRPAVSSARRSRTFACPPLRACVPCAPLPNDGSRALSLTARSSRPASDVTASGRTARHTPSPWPRQRGRNPAS